MSLTGEWDYRMRSLQMRIWRQAGPSSASAIANRMLLGATVVAIVSAALFYCLPGLDISTSSLFFGPNRFNLASSQVTGFFRLLAFLIFAGVGVLACLGLALSCFRGGSWLGVTPSKWLFLAMCLAIGPGLIGNYAFKDNWGRARPSQIAEFGGTKSYTLPLTPADQCGRNCSFVSGEASNVYMAFFALALVFLSHARLLIWLGIVGGSLAGLVRISQGAHFLSDVIFAGVIMAATAALLEMLYALLRAARQAGGAGTVNRSLA